MTVESNIRQEGISRILTGHRFRFLAPDHLKSSTRRLNAVLGGVGRKLARAGGWGSGVGWVTAARRLCRGLTTGDWDVILATGPPFEAFQFARTLNRQLSCPFVLDYRDPWTDSPHRRTHQLESRREASLVAEAAAITITSRSWADLLTQRHGIDGKVVVIPNGYDPEELSRITKTVFDHFSIVYTGTFYPPKRVVSPLMAALAMLAESQTRRWRFHYFGSHSEHIMREARRFQIADWTTCHGSVQREEALAAIAGAGVAIVVTSVFEQGSAADRGILTGKVFESIGLGVPTLAIAPRGSDLETVAERAGGLVKVLQGNQTDAMARYLSELMAGAKSGAPITGEYNWNNIAAEMDTLLRKVTSTEGRSTQSSTGGAPA